VKFPVKVDDNNLDTVLAENTKEPDTFYLDICPDAQEIEANLK
jgi:hypothetical protein